MEKQKLDMLKFAPLNAIRFTELFIFRMSLIQKKHGYYLCLIRLANKARIASTWWVVDLNTVLFMPNRTVDMKIPLAGGKRAYEASAREKN